MFVLTLKVVEIGKGSKVKYELDKKTGLIKVRFIYFEPLKVIFLMKCTFCKCWVPYFRLIFNFTISFCNV
jgi:inorganic pyrophosphatase